MASILSPQDNGCPSLFAYGRDEKYWNAIEELFNVKFENRTLSRKYLFAILYTQVVGDDWLDRDMETNIAPFVSLFATVKKIHIDLLMKHHSISEEILLRKITFNVERSHYDSRAKFLRFIHSELSTSEQNATKITPIEIDTSNFGIPNLVNDASEEHWHRHTRTILEEIIGTPAGENISVTFKEQIIDTILAAQNISETPADACTPNETYGLWNTFKKLDSILKNHSIRMSNAAVATCLQKTTNRSFNTSLVGILKHYFDYV